VAAKKDAQETVVVEIIRFPAQNYVAVGAIAATTNQLQVKK
jgi:hypothetical protein